MFVTALVAMVVVLLTSATAPVFADNGAGSAKAGGGAGTAERGAGVKSTGGKSTAGSSTGGKSTRSTGSTRPRGAHVTSGEAGKPQPISSADDNTGGANGQCPAGPYCSTRDGSPSGNGVGGGKATGKPAAGAVGRADNKNPPGQYPGGSDHNAGYECDRNQGIGKTNPAHTGCTTPTTTTPCAAGGQVPCEVAGPCVADEQVPCEGAGPCVVDEQVPCEGAGPCVTGGQVPCEGAGPCVAGEQVPCEGAGPCVTGGQVPCEGAGPCVAGEQVPCAGVDSAVLAVSTQPVASVRAAGHRTASSDAAPASRAGLLPATGSPASLAAMLLGGLALVSAGAAMLLRRTRA